LHEVYNIGCPFTSKTVRHRTSLLSHAQHAVDRFSMVFLDTIECDRSLPDVCLTQPPHDAAETSIVAPFRTGRWLPAKMASTNTKADNIPGACLKDVVRLIFSSVFDWDWIQKHTTPPAQARHLARFRMDPPTRPSISIGALQKIP
jgi:hypothetical protein